MGNNCPCKVIQEDSQLTTPQEELATSSKVVPKKKSYRKTKRNLRHCKPSPDSGRSAAEPRGDAGSSNSSAEVALVEKPAGFINTESHKHSRISEMETVCLVEKSCGPADDMNSLEENSLEENSVENEMSMENNLQSGDLGSDADDHEEGDSGSGMENEHIRPSDPGYGSDIDETEDINSMTDMSSDSLESEHCVDVLSDKDQMKTTPKEETNTSPAKVQSRKCRWLRSMMRRLGLWHTKSSSIRPQTSTVHMIEKACNTSEDMFPDIDVIDDNNAENGLSPEASLNWEDRELCEEDQMKTLQEAAEPSLVAVQSRKRRYVTAVLKKLGVRCCITKRNAERSESSLVNTSEKACGTADDLYDEVQMKTSQGAKPLLVVVQSRKCTCDPAELKEGPFGPPRDAWE